ncbi:hypothetical protein Acr_07g0013020 [Actinidia rufa]|uniref:CCHC-type domain-containing protein n=1 Tax=Actinidia rufa TaxID=165716 RepID=A0A7J0EY46_9ERIC|nr:hypothetical protein Acr_07g0013020 [Actinidia rufa]
MAQVPRANTLNRAMEVVREFRKLNPPMFDGVSSDPLVANHWLSKIRKLFDVLDVTEDAVRVKLVACQLSGEANEWWKSILATRKSVKGNSSRPPMTCHQCGQPGHIRTHCPNPKTLPPPPSRVQGAPGACFGCGGFGHVANFCPQGVHTQTHYRQTTSGQGSQVDRGASSSTSIQATQGWVFAVIAATPPPPPTSQTLESSVVQGHHWTVYVGDASWSS